MTQLVMTAGGYEFLAETHPDAPKTVDAFMKLLPYQQKLIHVRWSGEGMWVPLGDFDLGVSFENHTSHPSVGDILFYPAATPKRRSSSHMDLAVSQARWGNSPGITFLQSPKEKRTFEHWA